MTKRWLQRGALLLALVASLVLLFAPTYDSVTSGSDGVGVASAQTLLQAQGPGVLVVLILPVVASALPLLARGRAWTVLSIVSAAVLGLVVLLGALTVGVFFLPSAVLAVIAACLPGPSPRAVTVRSV